MCFRAKASSELSPPNRGPWVAAALAHLQPTTDPAADVCFAQPDVVELTIELATFRLSASGPGSSSESSPGCPGPVTAAKLRDLLAEEHESDVLEYVSACDVRVRREIVELATEVGALAARGGHVVIGVDDRGRPAGTIDLEVVALFDDATVRDKLAKYLPPSSSTSASTYRLKARSLSWR